MTHLWFLAFPSCPNHHLKIQVVVGADTVLSSQHEKEKRLFSFQNKHLESVWHAGHLSTLDTRGKRGKPGGLATEDSGTWQPHAARFLSQASEDKNYLQAVLSNEIVTPVALKERCATS